MSTAATLSRRRKLAFGGLTVTLALAAGLAAAELALRAEDLAWRTYYDDQGLLGRVTRASENPRLVWEYAPDARSEERWGPIETNAFGFRERALASAAKPPGVRRVAVIGDSVTLGLFVPVEETFVRRTEALLRGAHGLADVEVLNFGVDGYDAAQIAEVLATKVAQFEPDLVVYALCANDFDHEISSGQKSRYFEPPRSFVLQAARRAWASLRVRAVGYHRYVYDLNRAKVWGSLRAMRASADAMGAELCVALPPLFPVAPLQPEFSTEPVGSMREYPAVWAEIRDGVLAFLAGEGLAALDLAPAFSDVDDPHTVAFDVWHPRSVGHARIAAALAPFIAARL